MFKPNTVLSTTFALSLLGGCNAENIQTTQTELSDAQIGKELFQKATFGGNGRTCLTCHEFESGTLSQEKIAERFASFLDNGKDPLFRSIDSDDGAGSNYARLVNSGTFRVTIPLPSNIKLADDPTATSVTLVRGQGSTTNIGLDPVLMWDGRHFDLESQSQGAVDAHYEATETPTDEENMQIATFQQERLFSSDALKDFANGGPAPELPAGTTESEIRGRVFFVFNPSNPGSSACAICHSGPMLNTAAGGPAPKGARFLRDAISEFNVARNPVRSYILTKPDGSTLTFTSPDPGRVLITGNPADIGRFKIPSLWNVKNTAPYFHDNSAKTLEDVAKHYSLFFPIIAGANLTAQQQADIIAYLKLL